MNIYGCDNFGHIDEIGHTCLGCTPQASPSEECLRPFSRHGEGCEEDGGDALPALLRLRARARVDQRGVRRVGQGGVHEAVLVGRRLEQGRASIRERRQAQCCVGVLRAWSRLSRPERRSSRSKLGRLRRSPGAACSRPAVLFLFTFSHRVQKYT